MKPEEAAWEKARTRKNRFANFIVVFCLVVALAVTAAVVWEYHRLGEVMPAGVVTALLGLWGGELLILAARQVLGSDALSRGGEESREDGEYNSGISPAAAEDMPDNTFEEGQI